MRLNKHALLGSAAMVAIVAASPASAFNKVEWKWDLDFYENIYKTITIDVEFDPTGVGLIQFSQTQIGDVSANALMYDVHNNPHVVREDRTFDFTATGTTSGSLDVTGTAEGFVDIDSTGNAGTDDNQQVINGYIGIAGNPTGDSTSDGGVGLVDGAFGDEDPLTVEGTTSGSLDVAVSGSITVPVVVPLDAATELPKFENLATAVGNNASIDSNRMVEFHGGQFLFDVVEGENGGSEVPGVDEGGLEVSSVNGGGHGTDPNPYSVAGNAITLAAILGYVDKADITANADMHNVRNGQMENAATAVGNNFSASVEAATDGDAIIMGDLTQVAVADVSSTATMYDVSVRNYSNLNALEGPLFSNVATSIGNNLSLSISGPSVDVGEPGGGGNGGGGSE